MPPRLRLLLLMTDVGFLLYWSITALVALGSLKIPNDWLFKDYTDPNIVAWNWSFMPLDLIASILGLIAVARAKRGGNWRAPAFLSMALTFCAGFMALSFWTFQRSFDLGWWMPNLFLTLWPTVFIGKLRSNP